MKRTARSHASTSPSPPSDSSRWPREVQTHTEDFLTSAFEDVGSTTADWDTSTGELRLPDFTPSLTGSYDTLGDAYHVEAHGTTPSSRTGRRGSWSST